MFGSQHLGRFSGRKDDWYNRSSRLPVVPGIEDIDIGQKATAANQPTSELTTKE